VSTSPRRPWVAAYTPRSTLLEPIAKQIEECTRGPGVLGTDASAIPILDPEMEAGIRTGAMWVWTNARWVSFLYSPSGDSDSVRCFLKGDLARTVQCDGTSVTSFIERSGGTRPGCWSHGRRRFVEAARAGDRIALEALQLIAPIFGVERESMMAGDCSSARRARRVEKTRPLLDALRIWVDRQLGRAPPKTPLGKALGYLDRQWRRLVLFVEDGNVEATNNRRERELRRPRPGKEELALHLGRRRRSSHRANPLGHRDRDLARREPARLPPPRCTTHRRRLASVATARPAPGPHAARTSGALRRR
jgi:transposase